MKPEGRIRVFVRSRRAPVGTVLVTEPVYTTLGTRVGTKSSMRVVYDTVLEESHQRTIEEAEKLASNLGLGFEVVDESKWGLINRLVRLGRGGTRFPSVVVSPSLGMVASNPSPTLSSRC